MHRTRAAVALALAAGILLAPSALAARADAPPTINVGGQVVGLALSPDGKTLYAAKPTDSTIHVYDTATRAELASIPVSGNLGGQRVCNLTTHKCAIVGGTDLGSNPFEIALSPDGTVLAVGNISGSGTTRNVVLIDTQKRTIVGVVPVESAPTSVQITAGGLLLVSTGPACTVDVVDLNKFSGAVDHSIPLPRNSPTDPCFAAWVDNFEAAGGYIFASDSAGHNLDNFETGVWKALIVNLNPGLSFDWISSMQAFAVFTEDSKGAVAFLGGYPPVDTSGSIAEVATGAAARGAVDFKRFLAYVTNGQANGVVTVVDLAQRKVLRTIGVGPHPVDLVLNSTGDVLYVANRDAGTISVVSVGSSTSNASGGGGTGSGTVTASTPTPTDVASATPTPSAVALDAASTTHGISPLLWVVIGLGVLLLAGIGVLIYVLARPKPTA